MTGLIVAGFHRSGTSSVAQMLDNYGLTLGLDLMEGDEFNRFGHFECWQVVRFHDSVLQRIGTNWSTLLDEPIEFTEAESRWVKQYVQKRSEKGVDWALKDPRMCRFMHQWKDQVPDLKFLIVYRKPSDACQSLIRRSNMLIARSGNADDIVKRFYNDPDLALKLWIEHNRELLNLVERYAEDCVIIGHHHVLDGYDFMPELEARFGIKSKVAPTTKTIDSAAISPKLPALYCSDENLIIEAQNVWRDFEEHDVFLARGAQTVDIKQSFILDFEGQNARLWMAEIQMSELYKEIQKQRSLLRSKDNEIKESWQNLEESQKKLEESQKVINESQRAIGESHHKLEESRKKLEESWQKLGESQKIIGENQEELRENKLKIENLEALLRSTRPLAEKLSKPPFSFYFMKRAKYRALLEKFTAR